MSVGEGVACGSGSCTGDVAVVFLPLIGQALAGGDYGEGGVVAFVDGLRGGVRYDDGRGERCRADGYGEGSAGYEFAGGGCEADGVRAGVGVGGGADDGVGGEG